MRKERVSKTTSKRSAGDKTKLEYWKSRVFRPTYIQDGQKLTSPNFCVEMQHGGMRHRWSLGPANLNAAASKARAMYLFLVSNGWEATKAKYNPTAAARRADRLLCSWGDLDVLNSEQKSLLWIRTPDN
jgi:hypothetical protein